MKMLVWVLVIGAAAVALGLLTDLAPRERVVLAAVIGGVLVVTYEVLSDRRAQRSWDRTQRPR